MYCEIWMEHFDIHGVHWTKQLQAYLEAHFHNTQSMQMNQMAQDPQVTRQFARMEVIIDSMTPAERRNPDVLNGSRKRRITAGSGTTIQDLNRLLKQHKQMGKMMKKMKGKGMQNMMQGFSGMGTPASRFSSGGKPRL